MNFDTSTLAVDVPSAAAIAALHRALLESCRRSYRWCSVPQGDAANHLHMCVLRRLVALLRRAGHAHRAQGDIPRAMTRAQHNATLAAVVSSAIRPSALSHVDEFNVLMWDSVSAVFPSDQTLADAVIHLAQDNAALEALVHDALLDLNSIAGCTSATYEFDLVSDTTPAHANVNELSARQRVAFVSQRTSPENSSLNSSTFNNNHQCHSTASVVGNHPNNSTISRQAAGSIKSHRSVGGVYNSSTSTNRGKTSPSNLNVSPSSSWQCVATLWSRQTLLLVLFLIITVSLLTSFQAWKELQRGEAAGTFSPRGKKKPQSVLPAAMNLTVSSEAFQSAVTSAPVKPPFITEGEPKQPSSRSARRKRTSNVLRTLHQREQELLESMHVERALSAVHAAEEQDSPTSDSPLPAPSVQPPAVTNPCGSDSTKNPSGLPGRSYDPVDSVIALSFDLSDNELATIDLLEASSLATRHTFIRDIVARAMDANAQNEESPYHTFFRDRKAKMEMVDPQDQLAPYPATGNMPTTASISEEMVLLRRRTTAASCPAVQPALVDAVYTYVNPNSASHKAAVHESCRARGRECSDHRFRDFNELMYSLRTVHHRGGMRINTTDVAGRFINNVFVVVADRDQVPAWLEHEPVDGINVAAPPSPTPRPPSDGKIIRHQRSTKAAAIQDDNHSTTVAPSQQRRGSAVGRVFSVTHKDIFPPEVHGTALPNFNSFAIETNLHRIPGVGRFFVYFNNDMLWGRRVSYFDYFRPISHARQQHRIATTVEGQCLAEHLRSSNVAAVVGAESPADALKPLVAQSRRAVVFMEPIHYFDRSDELADRKLTPKYSPALPPSFDSNDHHFYRRDMSRIRRGQPYVQPQFVPEVVTESPPPTQTTFEASLVSNDANNGQCALTPIKTDAIFRLIMKTPRSGDTQHKTTNYNRKLVFTNYGLPPSHSFAHYPGIYDRSILSRMLEDELKDEAFATRGARFRSPDSLWTTMVYPFAAFAHRRGVDRTLAANHLHLWTRRVKYEELSKDVARLGPLMDPNFGTLPEAYQGKMWLTPAAASAADLPPLTVGIPGHDVVREKLRDWLVTMDGKSEALYHFCMMTSGGMISMYHGELQHKMKLFVTLNDDLSMVTQYSAEAVASLLQLVSNGAPTAPWERVM
jgi:hypothetical protein